MPGGWSITKVNGPTHSRPLARHVYHVTSRDATAHEQIDDVMLRLWRRRHHHNSHVTVDVIAS